MLIRKDVHVKKKLIVLVSLLVLIGIIPIYGEIGLDNESKYGLELEYSQSSEFPGDITVEGIFIHENDDNYIVTLKYSDSNLVKVTHKGEEKVKTSFFNPPGGSYIKYSWLNDFDRITEGKDTVIYQVDKEAFKKVSGISIFLYDQNFDNQEENLTVYFSTSSIDFDNLPQEDSLKEGFEMGSEEVVTSLDSQPSSWAKHNIEELQLENILKDSVFADFSKGITRKDFVYLMVTIYEEITGSRIEVDGSIIFDDSKDLYVAKAATIGITSGIGDNKFGPDLVLDRETMTTFLIKTLNLAGVDLVDAAAGDVFADDDSISDWAKSFVYTAKVNEIMGGVGDNRFSPSTEALNEQVLYITHSLLKKYGSLAWYKEYDGKRLYLKFEEKLYNLELENNVLINDDDQIKLYLNGLKDINTVLNALLLEKKDLDFHESSNPSIEGTLKEFDYNKMTMEVQNIFLGVDKVGEKTLIDFTSENYGPQVTRRFDRDTTTYKDFELIKYYDFDNMRQSIDTLSLDKIAEVFEFAYEVTYNKQWDIYIIEKIVE